MVEETAYDARQIQVLEGLQAVRKRPAMYVGSVDSRGLHHLVHEVVDNSIDEAMAGFCKEIQVKLSTDVSVTVADDGRWIPVDLHPKYGVPGVELVLSRMHSGGKFERKMYRVSGGLHGVGLSVVNGLSEKLEVRVRREGKEHRMRFERGQKASNLEVVGSAKGTGTTISFRPDSQIFEEIEFDYEILAARLRELAFLNAGLLITITDKIRGRRDSFQYQGGISEYVKWINRAKTPLHADPIRFAKESDGTLDEVAMQYHDGFNESIFTFVNNIDTIEGGTHLVGFKAGLARVFIKYAKDNKYLKQGESLEGDDVREALQAILPRRGKILNVEKARLDQMLKNEEIRTLITAIGASIADEFDLSKVRYHKIIGMSDADVDGQHITTLLLTLFFRYMRPLIDAGFVYIAQPPLYKIRKGKETHYAYSERQREELVKKLSEKGLVIQRYKGLGEMNAEELWETTMDPDRRLLKQVTIDDAAAADALFSVLMGEAVEPRRQYIQEHAKEVLNLDI